MVAGTGLAQAAPGAPADARHARAMTLADRGEYEQALAVIDEGLAIAPGHVRLLCSKGLVLGKLKEYLGELEAYEACVAAGATGAARAKATEIIAQLRPVRTSFLDITVANGPAVIHLDSRTERVFCTAAPSCHKGWPPRTYRVIAERPGFQTWTGPVTIALDRTATLAITLVEQPSPLTVRVAQDGARITVDDAAYTAPTTIPAGAHRVVVTLAGHAEARREIVASLGAPVELDVSLTPRVPIRVSPPTAELRLDDRPIAIVDGGLEVPPGAHQLVARASGFDPGSVAIPAARPADYAIAIALAPPAPPVASTESRFTGRRKIAVAVGGVAVVAVIGGMVLGTQAKQLEDDAYARCPSPSTPCARAHEANDLNKRGQSRALEANLGYGVAAGAAIAAAVLWWTGAPEARVAVAPRVGAIAGLDLAVRF